MGLALHHYAEIKASLWVLDAAQLYDNHLAPGLRSLFWNKMSGREQIKTHQQLPHKPRSWRCPGSGSRPFGNNEIKSRWAFTSTNIQSPKRPVRRFLQGQNDAHASHTRWSRCIREGWRCTSSWSCPNHSTGPWRGCTPCKCRHSDHSQPAAAVGPPSPCRRTGVPENTQMQVAFMDPITAALLQL